MYRVVLVLSVLLWSASCKPPTVDSPAQTGPRSAPEAAPAVERPEPERTGGEVTWQVPESWTAEEPKSAMRKAQYRVPPPEGKSGDAELAVFLLSGHSGTLEENVRRWRSQFGDAEANRHTVEAAAGKVIVVDITGTYAGDAGGEPVEDARMLVGVVEAPGGTWYFKLVGPEPTVSAWKDGFLDMLRGIKVTK